MPLAPLGHSVEARTKPQHAEIYMPTDRLNIRIERSPIDAYEACDGLFQLHEEGECIVLESAGCSLYIRIDKAQELAHAILAYKGEIEADRSRYVKAREAIGRRIRSGELAGFDDARIAIETERG